MNIKITLRNYSSFIRQTCKDVTIPQYNKNLQFALQVYLALKEIGLLYQVDPTLPFTEVQENPMVVDSISLPRDTLKRITGDCDDLTVLFCSILETVGIETGFITVPGHIYAVLNTKEESRNFTNIHPDREMTVNFEGELWVPVEITMIGNTGFQEAWRKGIEEWRAFADQPAKRGFYTTRESQDIYRPVGLRETDLGLQYGNKQNIIDGFTREMGNLIDGAVAKHAEAAAQRGLPADWNKLGIAYARFMRYTPAVQAFERAVRADRSFLPARINLANVLYLQKDYTKAKGSYESLVQALEQQGKGASGTMLKLLINLSRTCYMLEDFKNAGEYYEKAESIDPQTAADFAYLAEAATSSGTARSAEGTDFGSEILFIEGEEE